MFIKKLIFTAGILSGYYLNLSAQSYFPPKPEEATDAEYKNGMLILENSYAQMKGGRAKLAHDYWNIAVAYHTMHQPKDSIYQFLVKAKATNESDFCMIAKSDNDRKGGIEYTKFYANFGELYKSLVADCIIKSEPKIDPIVYAKDNGYDPVLVAKLDSLKNSDQRYRIGKYDPNLQTPLDEKNIKEVEKIIERYGYPGRSMVGKDYESIAWLVIQHSDLSYQEKYLPLIHKSVKSNELPEAPLKMLIDRIYTKKTGKQIFGSQTGVAFADEKTLRKVKSKYELK
jgi:hypothetical protein